MAVAAVAVRGWPLRMVAVLGAAASLVIGYLAVSLWVVPDVAVRAADLVHVPVVLLVGSERHYGGAAAALMAAVCTLAAAVVLMRSASIPDRSSKYVSPVARRSAGRRGDGEMSERMIWDALDEGCDPTDRPEKPAGPPDHESDTEGR
jgi:uncharacterized membrane protein (TIGR02234 family)